jgi:hypothetical protein
VRARAAPKRINVNCTLKNDYDSGVAGNAWANDTINRHLQIRKVGNARPNATTQYCAMVDDTGVFVTFAGVTRPARGMSPLVSPAGSWAATTPPSPARSTRARRI